LSFRASARKLTFAHYYNAPSPAEDGKKVKKMIIPPRTEPPIIWEYDVSTSFPKYTATVNPAGLLNDYYEFITSPSAERERFVLSLTKNIYKIDNQSVIELLS
jgi:hypothetical protein